MKRPRLKAVEARPGAMLELTFTSGQHFTLDMSHDLETYPGLKPLAEGKAFESAVLGDAGWTVEWPQLDIQMGADTLFLEGLAQAAPDENTRIFIQWRLRHRMTPEQAAAALGVSARGISRYSSGWEAVPRTLALACLGWDALNGLRAAERGQPSFKSGLVRDADEALVVTVRERLADPQRVEVLLDEL